MGLEIEEEDFYKWYREVMNPNSPYIVRERQETGTPKEGKGGSSVRGKGASGPAAGKKLEAVVEKMHAEPSELKKKLKAVQAKNSELEELRPAVEEYLREKGDFEEWKKTGPHRMQLVQELKGVEENRTQLQGCVLELQRERREYEQWKEMQEEKLKGLEKELKGAGEASEAAQARVLELKAVLEELIGEGLEEVIPQEVETLVENCRGESYHSSFLTTFSDQSF